LVSKDFFRFNFVIIFGFLLDFTICISFISIFKIDINISILIGFVSASIFNYIANKNYVFKTINQNKYLLLRYIILLIVILLFRIIFVRLMEKFIIEDFVYVSIIFTTFLTMFINFFLSKYFVFKDLKNEE